MSHSSLGFSFVENSDKIKEKLKPKKKISKAPMPSAPVRPPSPSGAALIENFQEQPDTFCSLPVQVNGKRGIFPTSYVSSMPECEGTKVRPLCSVDQLGFFCSILS